MSPAPETSHIRGEGFGSSHDWRGDTPQDNSKRTFYKCAGCGATFCHHYDAEPNIFAAMRLAGVVDQCRASTP
jgi:hypothetical protein